VPPQKKDIGVSVRHAPEEGLLSGMNLLLDPDAHPVIGHRGACGLAPENTMQSFALAIEQGADALEFDVRLSADGVPVVLHDPTLGRTCDRNEPVEALSAAILAEADAGYRFSGDGGATWPFRGRQIGIPSVADVLERFPETPLLIEVKEVRAARPLANLIRERGAAGRVVVASFLEEALLPCYEPPAIPTGASRRGILRLWLAAMTGFPPPGARYRAYAVPDRFRAIPPELPEHRHVDFLLRDGLFSSGSGQGRTLRAGHGRSDPDGSPPGDRSQDPARCSVHRA